jgi:hypothetical protein
MRGWLTCLWRPAAEQSLDGSGNPVNWERLVEELQVGHTYRQLIVAESTQPPHDQIMHL